MSCLASNLHTEPLDLTLAFGTGKNVVRAILILLAGGLVSGLIFLTGPEPRPGEEQGPPPHVARVTRVALQTSPIRVESRGTVTPRTATDVVAQLGGEVIRVADNFAAGGFFEAGEVLLEIDPRDYEIALARARADLADARRVLAEERGRARQAEREWQDLGDPAANRLFLREPQVNAAEAAVEAAEAGVRQARIDLERTEVSMPFDGRVLEADVDLGEYLTAGAAIGRVYATDLMEVRLPLSAGELELLNLSTHRTGRFQPLAVSLTSRAGNETATWQGRVVRVEAAANRETRLFHVVAQVSGSELNEGKNPLLPGMFVEAAITSNAHSGVARLPRSALYQGDDVMVLDGEDRLKLAPVRVLQVSEEQMAVKGLAEGQRVLVQPPDFIELGAVYRTVRAEPDDGAELPPASEGEAPAELPGMRSSEIGDPDRERAP